MQKKKKKKKVLTEKGNKGENENLGSAQIQCHTYHPEVPLPATQLKTHHLVNKRVCFQTFNDRITELTFYYLHWFRGQTDVQKDGRLGRTCSLIDGRKDRQETARQTKYWIRSKGQKQISVNVGDRIEVTIFCVFDGFGVTAENCF